MLGLLENKNSREETLLWTLDNLDCEVWGQVVWSWWGLPTPSLPQSEVLEDRGANHAQLVGEGKTTESSTERARQNRPWWRHLNLWLKNAQSQHHQWTLQLRNPVNSPFCLSQFELSFSVFCNWSIFDGYSQNLLLLNNSWVRGTGLNAVK